MHGPSAAGWGGAGDLFFSVGAGIRAVFRLFTGDWWWALLMVAVAVVVIGGFLRRSRDDEADF